MFIQVLCLSKSGIWIKGEIEEMTSAERCVVRLATNYMDAGRRRRKESTDVTSSREVIT